jgi:ABC-2 type transport system permease protein
VRRIRFLIWKELIELKEDPRLLVIVVVAPILQLIILGYAATTDVRNVPIVVADADRSSASRELIERFSASPTFTLVDVVNGVGAIDPYLESGRAWMAMSIPSQYGDSMAAGRSETLQLIADGSDANSSNLALGYATNLIAAYAQQLTASMPAPTGGAGGPAAAPDHSGGAGVAGPGSIDARVRVWFNPRLESRDFMIPGVLALLLLVVTTLLSSMGIVREKEVGTLEQLNVTPLARWELIVGKLLPYGLIGIVDVFLVIAVAVFWFDVPLRGSVWLLLAMTLVYLATTLGLGLFLSTISSTQQQAMMTAVVFFLTPMIYLSGFVFPIENMPAVVQWITYLVPLRYFLVILRAIFLKGVGLETIWRDALALTAWSAAIIALAISRSRKQAA